MQKIQLLFGFNSFGNHLQSEIMSVMIAMTSAASSSLNIRVKEQLQLPALVC
jgi:hypothetical protein